MAHTLRSRVATWAATAMLVMTGSVGSIGHGAAAASDTRAAGMPPRVAKAVASAAGSGTTVYLPNVTKMLGGDDGWQTPFIVQNIGTEATSVSVQFYAFSDGSLVKTRSVPSLPPGNSFFHDPDSDADLAVGGQYAVVIKSATSPVVAVVNEHQNVHNPGRQEALSYAGLSSGSTRLYAPYFADVTADGWLTTLILQNVSSAPATVTLTFNSYDGTKTATLTRSVAPGRAQFIDPRVEPTLVGGVEYSVTLTSTQPIGAVVNAHNDAATAVAPKGFSYNTYPATSAIDSFVPYAARNTDGIGRSTRLLIENAGSAPASPRAFFRAFGSAHAIVADGPSLAPGAAWAVDLRALGQLTDGEYGVHVIGGSFAVVASIVSSATAMGYSGQTGRNTKWFLPNVTRTLGGPKGWTTPIVIQPTSDRATTTRVSWYRFSDGSLVLRQNLFGLAYASSQRIDPRLVPGLTDDTQYAVVVEAPFGGIAAVVTELNFQGGDGAMSYQGFTLAPSAPAGTSSCSPATAPAGTTYRCTFYGLPPGGSPVNYSVTEAASPVTGTSPMPVAPDGSFTFYFGENEQGTHTMSVTVGTATASATFVTSGLDFAVIVNGSVNGKVSVTTSASAPCTLFVTQPDGTVSNAAGPPMTVMSDASGLAVFSYSPLSSPTGLYRHHVACTVGSETMFAETTFSVP